MIAWNGRAAMRAMALIFASCCIIGGLAFIVRFIVHAQNPPLGVSHGLTSISIYAGGNVKKSAILTPEQQHELETSIDRFLKKRSGKWNSSLASYAPGYIISGADATINLQSKLVIVNYKNRNGSHKQVVSEITDEESAELKREISRHVIAIQ